MTAATRTTLTVSPTSTKIKPCAATACSAAPWPPARKKSGSHRSRAARRQALPPPRLLPRLPPPPPPSTPVGPIVGGVIGGLSALALIVLGIWALMRQNNKRKEHAATTAASGASITQQHPSPSSNPHQDPHMSHLPAPGYYGASA